MEKAILILDEMPKCCDDYCPGYHDGNLRCTMMHKYRPLEDDCDIRRPEWCPLQYLPNSYNMTDEQFMYDRYCEGWNDCLDEIGGGTDDAG